jgi:hypothetical protein
MQTLYVKPKCVQLESCAAGGGAVVGEPPRRAHSRSHGVPSMSSRSPFSVVALSVVHVLALGAGSAGCLAPPVTEWKSGASSKISESAGRAPSAFYPPTWADSSGKDGKGGTKLVTSEGEKRTMPLREDAVPGKLRGDASTQKHGNWLVYHSAQNSGKSLAFEFKWVTTKDDKFYGNMWAGSGVAFDRSWTDTDVSRAKYLVMYVKASRDDLDQAEFTVKLAAKTAAKGQEQTVRVPLKAYAEGKRIGTEWTRVVIPMNAFTDRDRVDITKAHSVNFDLAGKWPENELVWFRIDDMYFSDAELLTPVDNVGFAVVDDGIDILWDKPRGERFDKFVVAIDGKSTVTVDAEKRSAKLPLSALTLETEHKVTVVAANPKETSTPQAVTVKRSGVPAEPAVVTVDGTLQHEISPFAFGTNFMSPEAIRDTGATLNRWGGNATSTYNWKTDNDNKGLDWFFLDDYSKPPGTPESEKTYFKYIRDNLAAGAAMNFTIPIGDWIAKGHPSGGRYCSFPTSIYPDQDKTDGQGCGNGVKNGGKDLIWGNDPNVSMVPNSVEFQRGLVETIKKSFGGAAGKGVRFYSMDNEPGLWNLNHRDIAPKGISTDELIERNVKYATMVKSVDPDAKVIGFAAWGSMLELAGSNVDYMPPGPDGYKQYDKVSPTEKWSDRKRHGDQPQLVSFLKGMRAAEQKAGRRVLDVVDVHWYPEVYGTDSKGNKRRLSEDHAKDPVLLPKQVDAVREWYDPTFKPEWSWANEDPVRKYLWEPFHPVIPALRRMVEQAYPGTKLAINEYDTGSPDQYHGAIIRAAVLGVFMQEDLYMGQNWHQGDAKQPAYWAQKLYGNYDGRGGSIRGRFVKSSSTHKDLCTFAAANGGKTQVVLINKSQTARLATTVKLPRTARTFQTYTLSEGAGQRIVESAVANPKGEDILVQVPAFSVVLVVATL